MNLSTYRCVNDIDVAELVAGMDQAERSGMFDGVFSRELLEPVLGTASKEQLLQSIAPTMKLTKGFFKRIYGYELTWPGFADQAIKALLLIRCNLVSISSFRCSSPSFCLFPHSFVHSPAYQQATPARLASCCRSHSLSTIS